MSQEMAFVGNVRGVITEYGLSEMESGAVAVNIAAKIHAFWDAETSEWVDCSSDDYLVKGDVWVVKKDGTLNTNQAQSLIDFAGWDGNLESLVAGTWQPTQCSFVMNRDTYKDQERFRISFLNAYDRKPGALGTISAEKAKALQQTYGSQLRALVGNAKSKATPAPAGKPSPKPTAKAKTPTFDTANEAEARGEAVPF